MNKFLFILFLAINVFCFITVRNDDRLASSGNHGNNTNLKHRAAKVELMMYSAFGGSIGAYLGLKTNKDKSFVLNFVKHSFTILFIENFILFLSLFINFRKRKS